MLIKVAGSYTLTDAQREAYLKAADTIDAEYEAGKVLAALRRRPGG